MSFRHKKHQAAPFSIYKIFFIGYSDPFGAKIIAEEHPLGTPLSFDAAMLTETELNSVNNSKTMVTDQEITQSFLINERQKNEMQKKELPNKDRSKSVSQRTSVSSARSKQSTSKTNHFSLKHYMSNNSRKISDSSRKQSNASEVRNACVFVCLSYETVYSIKKGSRSRISHVQRWST